MEGSIIVFFCKIFYQVFIGKMFYNFLQNILCSTENILLILPYFTCKQAQKKENILQKIFYFQTNKNKK